MPSLRWRSGSTSVTFCNHPGASSSGKKVPLSIAIGSTRKLAMFTAPSAVLATAPASRPSAMNDSVPTTSSGTDAHHAPDSCRPKAAAPRPRKMVICTSATPTVTTTRAATTAAVGAGESCSRRNSWVCRQPCSVAAAPIAALIATAHPSRPGVKYWIASSESSSTLRGAKS